MCVLLYLIIITLKIMDEKEIFERLKDSIISDFRNEITWYQENIEKTVDVYVWLNIKEDKMMYFFTTPEDLGEDDFILFKTKSNAIEDEFKEIENYLKNLSFEFLPLLKFNWKLWT